MVLDDYKIIFNIINSKTQLHALLCAKTNRLITISNWSQTISCLETHKNTQAWYYIKLSTSLPKKINLNLSFDYYYNCISGNIEQKEIEENEILPYLLISEKSSVLDFLHKNISLIRKTGSNSLPLQDKIYLKKYQEAVSFLDNKEMQNLNYLECYSKTLGIDKKEAANRIINKHVLFETLLESTENIRIKYISLIRNANSLEEINLVLDNLHKEINIYGTF